MGAIYLARRKSESSGGRKTGNGGKLTVQKKANEIGIYNDRINIVFNKKAGLIQSWIVGGKEFLEKGPQINLWRAPTHNDGGYRPKTENEISRQWVEAGLDSLQHKLKSFKLVEEKNGTVSVATTFVAQKREISRTWNIPPNILLILPEKYR